MKKTERITSRLSELAEPRTQEKDVDWLRKKGTSDENIDRVRNSTAYAVEMDRDAIEDMQSRYSSGELVGAELVHPSSPSVSSL